MSFVWLNGNLVDEAEASVSVRDTGLLHAAGVFTTLRSAGGQVIRLPQHLARLRESCDILFIPLLHKDSALSNAVSSLLKANDLSGARLRMTVTRGQASNDPRHGLHLQPNVLITAAELETYPAEYYEKGLTVLLLDDQKLNPYDIQAGHKTLNYFSRLAALREANRRGAGEALWFNVHNYLQSGSISNVFLVKEGKLITPPTNAELHDSGLKERMPYSKSNVLPGVTRAAVLELARANKIAVELAAVTVDQLLSADEIFLSNSIMDVISVCRIERHAIGDDKPGPITRRLQQALRSPSHS